MSEALERAVAFECGGDTLVGILHPATGSVRDVGVLVVVGGPQYRVGSHRQFVLMARALANSGFSVLRFDYRGMGDSDGEVRSFEQVSADIEAAIDAFLRELPSLSGVVLWGLCDAASACLMYRKDDPRVRGLILVNPWVRTVEGEARTRLKHYYLQRLFQVSFWRSVVSGKFKLLTSMREFLGSVAEARSPAGGKAKPTVPFVERMRQGLATFRGPSLFLISERDLTAREFLDLCAASGAWKKLLQRPGTQLVHLQGADHTFSAREALDRATEECRRWLAALPC